MSDGREDDFKRLREAINKEFAFREHHLFVTLDRHKNDYKIKQKTHEKMEKVRHAILRIINIIEARDWIEYDKYYRKDAINLSEGQ